MTFSKSEEEYLERMEDNIATKTELAVMKAIEKHKSECDTGRREWKKIVQERQQVQKETTNIKIPVKFWVALTGLILALTALVSLGVTYLAGKIG